MPPISVDLEQPSPYLEPSGFLYRFKRSLTYRFAFKAIRRYGPKARDFSLLEIGTGAGYFLATVGTRFPGARLAGLEYDPRLLEATQRRAPGATCIQGNAESFSFENARFDVIVSFQVIEHLYSPEAMLANVKKHLKPGGIFIMTTPNLDSLGARLLKERWHGFREDHVSLKTFDQWRDVLQSAGFNPIYCGSTFFSGIPILNRPPLGIINWMLLVLFSSAPWKHGESFITISKIDSALHPHIQDF